MGNCVSDESTQIDESNLTRFVEDIKKLHNNLRKQYKSPPLKYNKELNKLAKAYAKEIISSQKKVIYKPNIYKGTILGESVIMSDLNDPQKILENWKQEGDNYDFSKNKFSKITSHFTQIIWKETTDIGIGFFPEDEKKENEKYCIVILYYPPGNTLGNFSQNVTK